MLGRTIFILFILLCLANLALCGIVYGTVYGKQGLLNRYWTISGSSVGPTGPSSGGGSLATLSDVSLTNPLTTGNSLVYVASAGKWENQILTLAAARYAFLGSDTLPTPTITLFLQFANTWYNIFEGGTGVLTQNTTGYWDINNNAPRLLNNSQWFVVNITLSLSAAVQADVYQISIFIDGVIVPDSVVAINFPGTGRVVSYSSTKLVSLNQNQRIDVRMRDTSFPGRNILISGADLSLTSTLPL